MMTKRLFVILTTVILSIILPVASTFAKNIYLSDSKAKSKRNRIFLFDVNIRPVQFVWEGHNVEIAESWLEKSETKERNNLMIRFLIDGNRYQENRLMQSIGVLTLNREDEQIPRRFEPQFFPFLAKKRQILRNVISGDCEIMHYVSLETSPEEMDLNLKVGRRKIMPRKTADSKPNVVEMQSYVTLNIRLPAVGKPTPTAANY